MIGVNVDWPAIDVEMEMFTRPYDSEGFTLGLAVTLLSGGQRAAGICNDVFGSGQGINLR